MNPLADVMVTAVLSRTCGATADSRWTSDSNVSRTARSARRCHRGTSRTRSTPSPASPAPTTLQMFLSEYKTVNGIKLPHLMTRGANGEITEEWIVKNYRVNPNFNADTVSK